MYVASYNVPSRSCETMTTALSRKNNKMARMTGLEPATARINGAVPYHWATSELVAGVGFEPTFFRL